MAGVFLPVMPPRTTAARELGAQRGSARGAGGGRKDDFEIAWVTGEGCLPRDSFGGVFA